MGYPLTLNIPKHIYEPLVKTAEKTGRTPEELALEWLGTASCTASEDPVENFIGAFKSDIPDWADAHDKYIGQTLAKHMNRKGDEGN